MREERREDEQLPGAHPSLSKASDSDGVDPPADDAPATGTLAGAGTGALAGAVVGGPAGAAIGGAVGALLGALAGKAVEHAVDDEKEDAYWRQQYPTRPYARDEGSYDQYRSAYRFGWQARSRVRDRSFDELEPELERGWLVYRAHSTMEWSEARPAARDAWNRVDESARGERP